MGHSLLQKIAIGTAQFGMKYGVANRKGQINRDEAISILSFARSNGIDTIDTAKTYGNSEEVIGNYIKAYTDEYWGIITKVNKDGECLEAQINDSIDKLATTPFMVLAHSAIDYLDPIFCEELHELKTIHKIKKIGVSVYTVEEIKKVLSVMRPDVIQCPLNILDTKLYRTGILDEIKGKGIDIHIRSVFLQGLFYLSDEEIKEKFPDVLTVIKRLISIAKNAEITLAELSILWIASLSQVDKVIIGVDNVDQLNSHIITLNKKVDPAVFKEACELNYVNEDILNPILWPKTL